MKVAYNDVDDDCCEWLENLISDGQIPAGPVWCQGIETLEPSEIQRYEQVHFFAGIGGWALAAKWAGWTGPLWTASCPCQPFSVVTPNTKERKLTDDPRHLWPALRRLVSECQPPVVVGEQVAGALGKQWLAAVRLDLEDLGYAFGATSLPATSVGAPHVRERFYWGAARLGLADTARRTASHEPASIQYHCREESVNSGLEREVSAAEQLSLPAGRRGADCPDQRNSRSRNERARLDRRVQQENEREPPAAEPPWSDVEYIPFADGFSRPVPSRRGEPRVLPLVDGLPEGVATERSGWGALGSKYVIRSIKGYGNAIVPQVGAVFLKSLAEAMEDQP